MGQHIDFAYVNYNNLEDAHPELVPVACQSDVDDLAWERLLHSMPQEYLEVVVCLYMGLKPEEIVRVLQYPNIVRFYNINAKLRAFYRKQKREFLAYN